MTLAGQAVLVVVLLLTQQTIISFTNCAPNVNNDESIFYLAQIDSVLDYVKRADRVDFTFHKLVHAEEKDDLTYIDLEVVKHCPPEQTVCVTHLLRCLAQVRYDPSSRTYNTLPNIYCDENVTHDEQETKTAATTTTTTPQTATEQKEIEEEKVIKARVNDCLGCMVELNKNVEGSQILVDTAMHHIKSERDQFHVPLRILKLERQIVAGVKYSLLLEIAPTICSVTYMLQNCPVSENHEPEICRVVFLEKPWINKEKHIISNNCTVSQDFAPSKQSPNDLDNEIDINNDYRDTRPENYDENVSDKKPNFDMMAESGSIVDEAARLAELEAQIVSSPDIQPKKVNPIHATRTPVEDSEAGVEDIPVVRTTTTVNANPKESKSTQELFKVLLDGYHEVLGSDPFFWEMFSKWTPNGIVERFRREVRLGAPSSALGDPMVTELAKSTLQLLDGESSHEQKYKIKEITEATKQVVSGFKYIIKANVVLSDCAKSSKEDPDLCGEHPSKVNKACVFDIWSQPWLPEGRKTEVKCGAETYKFRTRRSVIHQDSKSSESDETHAKNKKKDKSKRTESSEEKGVTEEAIRVKRERLVGAPEGLETSDPEIQELTKSTLTYFDKRTTHDTKYKILNIRKASSQVVSGALYKITADIVLSDCPKSSNTDSSLCGVHPTKLQKTCDIRIWDQPWLPQGRKTNITCGTDTYSFRTDSTKHNKDSLKLTKKKREAVDDLQNLLVETELPQGSSSSSEEKKTNIRKRNVHDHSTSSSEEKKTLKLTQNKKEAVDDLKNLLVEKDLPRGSSSSSEEKKRTNIRKRNVNDHSTSSSEEKKTSTLKKPCADNSASSSEEKKTSNIRKRSVDDGDSASSSEELQDNKMKNEEKTWNRFPFLPVSSIIARRKGSKMDEDVDSISSLNSEDTFDRSKRAVTDRNNDSSSSSSSSSSDDDDNNDNTNKEKRTSKKASYKEEKKKDDKNDSSSSSSSSDDDNGNGNRRHKRNLDEHDEKALIARLAKIAAESLNDANNKNQVLEILRVNKLELEGAVYFLSARLGVGHCSGVESCLIDEEKLCKFKVHVSKNLEHVKVVQTHCHKIEKDSDKNRTNRRDKRQPVDKKTMQHVELFKTFVKEHRKVYKSYTDFQLRLKIFLKNMKTIETLNREEQGTAVYGLTKFADLTRKEFEQYLGYREDLRHENDISYSDAVIPDIELPESVDWREKKVVTHVKDQKQCGSCWAFSVTGNVEGQYAIKHGELLELSEQELVDCDEYDSGCNGGLMDNAYRAVEQLGGLETEDDYPYRADDEKCHFNKTLAKVRLSGAVNISQDESDMAKWLTQNGPMAIALNANAMQFYMGGVSHPMKFLCNPTALDHGVLIVGFGTHSKYDNSYPKFNKTLPYWIIKNSWGPKWGEQGYYRVYRGDGTCGVNQMVSSAIVE